MNSNERWFWVGMVVCLLVLQVVDGLGLAHRLWPGVFRQSACCVLEVPAHQAQAAIKSEAMEAAHG